MWMNKPPDRGPGGRFPPVENRIKTLFKLLTHVLKSIFERFTFVFLSHSGLSVCLTKCSSLCSERISSEHYTHIKKTKTNKLLFVIFKVF